MKTKLYLKYEWWVLEHWIQFLKYLVSLIQVSSTVIEYLEILTPGDREWIGHRLRGKNSWERLGCKEKALHWKASFTSQEWTVQEGNLKPTCILLRSVHFPNKVAHQQLCGTLNLCSSTFITKFLFRFLKFICLNCFFLVHWRILENF